MEITLSELGDLLAARPITTPSTDLSLVGQSVIIRTVTHYHVGRVVAETDRWLTLEDASWIADTGRWNTALTSGVLGEIEPFPSWVRVSVGAIIDIAPWVHALPREQK